MHPPLPSVYHPSSTAGHSSSGNLSTTPATTSRYQNTELILYGSIKAAEKDQLLQRLKGLCDPGVISFQEHNMCFKLSKTS